LNNIDPSYFNQIGLIWLLAIGVFLFLAGLGKLKVADSVLIALITTTTANVLGLFYIVARWLFPHKLVNESLKQDQPVKDKKAPSKKTRAKK
jgi:hypothetical protein